MIPSDIILRGDKKLEAGFAVGAGHVKERIILQSTSDSDHEDALQVRRGGRGRGGRGRGGRVGVERALKPRKLEKLDKTVDV